MTPEGKVKALINKALAAFGDDIYKFMPVPSGFGPSSLDYILCIRGIFVAIEAKKPGGKTTPRQDYTIEQIKKAGGYAFVVEDAETLAIVVTFIQRIISKQGTI